MDLPFTVKVNRPKTPTAVTCQPRGYDADIRYIRRCVAKLRLGAQWL